jgi:hypothetical protein
MDLPLGLGVASQDVVLEGVDPRLLKYAEHLGMIHRLVFGKDLVITSGKEGKHVQNSFHEIGRALDVRTEDKDQEEQLVFMTLVSFSAPAQGVAVFDERSTHDAKHVHLEFHGA